MCGLAGILNINPGRRPEKDHLISMIHQLHHRGPDDYGFYVDEHIGLAHSRLSIIDLDNGHQPMHDSTKNIWIVFNGEIFNYIELRNDLKKEGVIFHTKSDTEVIIYLYKKYQLDFINYLNGQFSIALWDKEKNRLILARDRVGINPLFFYKENNRIYFASEIKAIIPVMDSTPSLNADTLDQILTFWSPVSPNTLFDNIYEVRPGELIVIREGIIKHHRYWEWKFPVHSNENYLQGNEDDLAEELHDKLIESTKLRLRADVPVAAYLSGGLDSSALVALIHHHGDVPLRTFSINFEDKRLDESKYQKQLIDHLGTDNSAITCSTDDIANSFERTIWHTESPILRSAPTPMMLLSGLVRDNNYKVVLTGEGADEVFGGYDIFKEGKIRQFWAKNKDSSIRPNLLKRLYPYLDITQSNSKSYLEAFFGTGLDKPELPYFAHLPRWATTAKIKMFYSDDIKSKLKKDSLSTISQSFNQKINTWHPFNRSQYIEARSLMSQYLLSSQGDRMLMSNSVEGRFPFLDHNVIEFANKLNPNLKMKVLNEKYLLKKAMERYLPNRIINRKKQPYRAPDIPAFFGNKTPDYVNDLLSEPEVKDSGYFDPKKVTILVKKIKAGKAVGYKDNMSLMAILSTQIWHQKFIKSFNKHAY